jgi:predicted TIM-barrel fold metal-dependent hydrolase
MQIIDSQVHAFDDPDADVPWLTPSNRFLKVDGAGMVAAMDAVGVAGAVMISPFGVYRYDTRFIVRLGQAHPDRFALAIPVDPHDPKVGEVIAEWARVKGAVAVRIIAHGAPAGGAEPDVAGYQRVFDAAARHGLVVNLMCSSNLDLGEKLIAGAPNTRIVIDHLGLEAPWDEVPAKAFVDLPRVLSFAKYDHVAMKISGACALSHEPFPFKDLWDPLARMFDAFGLERCMWGTDWTRTASLVTYGQSVEAFRMYERLSASDKAMLMGGALSRIYDWAPSGRAEPVTLSTEKTKWASIKLPWRR